MLSADRILSRLDALLQKNDYQAAKQHLLYWLDQAKNANDNKIILLLNNELMGLCRKLCDKEQALFYANEALKTVDIMNIQTNVGAATTYLNGATVFKAFSLPDDSILLFEKARKIYEANLSKKDPRLAGLYNNMALTLVDLGRFDEANDLYKKALLVLDGDEHNKPEMAITYLNIATAAEAQLGLEVADQIIAEYLQLAATTLDECKYRTDGNYAFVCEKCSSVFGYYGYFDYENQLKERYRRIYEGA